MRTPHTISGKKITQSCVAFQIYSNINKIRWARSEFIRGNSVTFVERRRCACPASIPTKSYRPLLPSPPAGNVTAGIPETLFSGHVVRSFRYICFQTFLVVSTVTS